MPPPPRPGFREALAALGALAVASCLFFFRLLGTGGVFCERDMQRVYFPAKWFWAEQVRRGEWPGWYPYNGLGQPFAGATVTGAFHPGNVLFFLFEPATALTLLVLLCYPLAGTGTYLFLRARGARPAAAAVGALAFAFGGYLVSLTNNLPYLQAATALPWVLVAADAVLTRASWTAVGALGLFLSLPLLAGDPQNFVVAGATVVLLAALGPTSGPARKRVLALTAAGLGLAALVCTVQLWASSQALREMFAERRTAETAQLWSVHPLRLLDLALGDVFALDSRWRSEVATGLLGTQVGGFWARALYVGLPVLLLAGVAGVARRQEQFVRLALGLLVLALLLMLGRHTPLYGWLYTLLPPWRAFRYPEKLTVHAAFWLAVLAGLGADTLLGREPEGRRRAAWGLVGLGAGAVLLSLAARPVVEALRGLYGGAEASWLELSGPLAERLSGAAVLAGGACLLLGLTTLKVRDARVWGAVLVALVAVDLARASEPVYVACDRAVLTEPPPFLEALRQRVGEDLTGRARVYAAVQGVNPRALEGRSPDEGEALSATVGLLPDTGARWGVEHANWYLPALSARVGALMKDTPRWWSRYAGLAGVGFFTVDDAQVARRKQQRYVVAHQDAFAVSLLANPTALPRAYLARPRCVAGPEESLALVASPEFVPGREAAVECPAPLPMSDDAMPLGTATVTTYEAQRVEVDVEAAGPAVLVLSDPYFSGWSATVDGASTEVLPANHAFRAVPVPAGRHHVTWRYRMPGQTAAFSASALGVALCLLPWPLCWLRRRSRPSQEA